MNLKTINHKQYRLLTQDEIIAEDDLYFSFYRDAWVTTHYPNTPVNTLFANYYREVFIINETPHRIVAAGETLQEGDVYQYYRTLKEKPAGGRCDETDGAGDVADNANLEAINRIAALENELAEQVAINDNIKAARDAESERYRKLLASRDRQRSSLTKIAIVAQHERDEAKRDAVDARSDGEKAHRQGGDLYNKLQIAIVEQDNCLNKLNAAEYKLARLRETLKKVDESPF